MKKVNQIELDRIKQGCSCRYVEGRTKRYKTFECKACLHKKGLLFSKEIEYQKQVSELAIKLKDYLEPKEKPIKRNWFKKLFNI